MRKAIETFNIRGFVTLACCCGHGEYPMTIIYDGGIGGKFELFSGVEIPRKRNFYKKDKQGYYFIPECEEARNGNKYNQRR